MRILFVQFGDIREAVYRLERGGPETYYAQEYTVETVEKLTARAEYVGVVCVDSDPYDEMLPNGVHGIGMRLSRRADMNKLVEVVRGLNPTHLFLRSPFAKLLVWGCEANIRTLPILADSFCRQAPHQRFRYIQLSRVLNREGLPWIANHGVNASRSLAAIGVKKEKIIPYDLPYVFSPDDYPVKTIGTMRNSARLIFVGTLSKSKGLDDCLSALKRLRSKGMDATLTIVGEGNRSFFERYASKLGIQNFAHFMGTVPHRQVLELMHQHDISIVASRRDYAEGFPRTIYETLCSRTPLIVSNHPMFSGKIHHGETGLVFRSGKTKELAGRIRSLMSNPELYERLSAGSKEAWLGLHCPVEWGDLIHRFLNDSEKDRDWFRSNSLASGNYDH
jgi:glycosyltransferase involved in cell wall biosynthesis